MDLVGTGTTTAFLNSCGSGLLAVSVIEANFGQFLGSRSTHPRLLLNRIQALLNLIRYRSRSGSRVQASFFVRKKLEQIYS
jgi:hypothetical protein